MRRIRHGRKEDGARRKRWAIGALALACALAAAAPTPGAQRDGRTFYVSPDGSDSRSGTSPARAWRTVRRVSRARLEPGDRVLFQGGATFRGQLRVRRSGRPGAPIVFGSYGTGKALLRRGVWFSDRSDLVFRDLAISGADQAVLGTGRRIVVRGLSIDSVGIGVHVRGSRWVVSRNSISRTGDSGMIVLGDRHRIERNSIADTGRDGSIPYGKHGIYLKAADTWVVSNTITGFADQGVSVRFRNSVLAGNVIAGGDIGIAWFQGDPRPGTSRWIWNDISQVTAACVYVSGSDEAGVTRERFVIAANRLRHCPVALNLVNNRRANMAYLNRTS